MTTVSMVTALYGAQYVQYLNRWWQSVISLNRQPDEIVLATGPGDEFGLLNSVPKQYLDIVVHIEADASGVHGPWYAGIQATKSHWIFGCGVDDQFSPDALNEIENASLSNADLIIDNIKFLQGGFWSGTWDTKNIKNRGFAPGGVAGHTQKIKHFWGLIPKNLRWNDWAFYGLCVKNNVNIYQAQTTRMIHDLGTGHQTISGVNRDSSQDQIANQELYAFLDSLSI
jgi:hypothetical protein